MLKVSFIISISFLLLLTIWRYLGNFFIDEVSLKNSFNQHLPYLIIGAITLGTFYLYFFKKVFPKGWDMQSSGGKVAIIFVFLLLAFAVLRQSSVTLNAILPEKGREPLNGIIIRKEIEKTRKGTKFYNISIESFEKRDIKDFSISKKEYNRYHIGDSIQRELITGFFGIKYSKD